MNPLDPSLEASETLDRATIAAQAILKHEQSRQEDITRKKQIKELQNRFDLTFGAQVRDYLETACDGLWEPAHPESCLRFWISGNYAELKHHFLSGWTWQCEGVEEKVSIRHQLLTKLGILLERPAKTHPLPIPGLIFQVQQIDPELANRLSTQISALGYEALLDLEGLLTQHLDLNIFNCSKFLVGAIEPLVRLVAALRNQSIEDVLLEVRYGDDWQTNVPDALPDWADATDFSRAIQGNPC